MSGVNAKLKRRRVRRPIRKVFISEGPSPNRVRDIVRRSIFWTATTTAALIVVGAIASVFFYNHYASIVEKRVNAGFWETRAGMYAAPYQIRKGQPATPEAIIELLRHAGYLEGEADASVWSGSYERIERGLKITTSNSYNLEPETTTIRFADGKVDEIRHNDVLHDAYEIEPEMLSGRSETKRGRNHVLKYEEIPEHLRHAIIAAEDQRFFEHYGLDPRGIARAFLANVSGREIKQGGSTITQQLVKNTFLTPERSFSRKFAEAFLALALENRMSKEDIFAVYCNEIYLGQYGASGVHGVEQAARAYFDKGLKDLTLAESAAIAAMIKNPNQFSPQKNPENARSRKNWILTRMQELGFSGGSDVELAQATDIKLVPPKRTDRAIAPYFVDAAMRELGEKFQSDYLNSNFNTRVYTTIDTQMQAAAERAVAKHLEGLDRYFAKKGKRLQATIVALDPHTGHVLAMVGGRDYRESQFNRATDARRAPGSTFKPFVYATAYERGFTPISVMADSPTKFQMIGGKTYEPANYRGSYTMGNITLKSAIVRSSNVVAVKTAMDVGLHQVKRKAVEFGFENIEGWPSMALGAMEVTPLQLAAAYAVFANGGTRVEPTYVKKVVSGSGETLHVSAQHGKSVLQPHTAYMITDALVDVVRRGTAGKAAGALGKHVVFGGKTGTTKDGWFVGYTPNLVTVAWVGLDNNEDLHTQAADIALPLWVDFMQNVVKLRPEYGGAFFPMPKGLVEVVIDPETGMAAGPYCPQRENAVVPMSAASYMKCLRHEPMETMFALDSVHETDPYVTDIEAVEVNPTYRERSNGPVVKYEDFDDDDNELVIRRPAIDEDESDPDEDRPRSKPKKPE